MPVNGRQEKVLLAVRYCAAVKRMNQSYRGRPEEHPVGVVFE